MAKSLALGRRHVSYKSHLMDRFARFMEFGVLLASFLWALEAGAVAAEPKDKRPENKKSVGQAVLLAESKKLVAPPLLNKSQAKIPGYRFSLVGREPAALVTQTEGRPALLDEKFSDSYRTSPYYAPALIEVGRFPTK